MSDSPQTADGAALAARLESRGLSGPEAAAKAGLLLRCRQALEEMPGPAAEPRAFYVPGRLEFLGKHTDYAGGRSVVCPIERGFCLLAAPREDNRVHLRLLENGQEEQFPLDPQLVPRCGHWTNYPMTVARRAAGNFPGALKGVNIVLASDLPPAAGMSSSSALVVASFLACNAANRFDAHPAYRAEISSREDLAGYLGCNENGQNFGRLAGDRGVGTFGGSEDHTAILCGQTDRLSVYSYCPVVFERTVPFPADWELVIGVSGMVAEKTGAAREAYNRASLRARRVLELCQAAGMDAPTLGAAVRQGEANVEAIRQALRSSEDAEYPAEDLLKRFEQFYLESERIIPAVADALACGNVEGIGELVDRSQSLSETHLENQVPETAFLAASARQLGAAAASAFGAGFGGSVWALVPAGEAEDFAIRWRDRYADQPKTRPLARPPLFFRTRPGPAAMEFDLP